MFSPTQHKREEYIPEQVHFSRLNFLAPNHSANKSSNENKHSSGDTLIEDFLVIGPDISSFKKLRETSRAESGLKVKPHLFFNVSKNFRQQKPEFL